MTIYYPKTYYDSSNRWHIFPLIKSLLKTPHGTYQNFQLTDREGDADVIVLPMSWNYYYRSQQVQDVLKYVNQELGYQKPILSFVFGDIGCKVPKTFKGVVFRASGRRSKLPDNHRGIPIFVKDPITSYFGSEAMIKKTVSTTPVVGFCGQAQSFGIQTLKQLVKVVLKNIVSSMGLRHQDTDALLSTTYFRWNILMALKRSNLIHCNFIIRRQYRAGVKTNKDSHQSTLEFYENIKASDYVVCMRGAGNFSTRFYETLAMGRIPIFVNTDCVLPLEDRIAWKEHVVWVDYHERHILAEKVADFHSRHNEQSLNALFLKNRAIWEDYLQLYPFFKASLSAIQTQHSKTHTH
ncbi:exostosin domain-containing protein [Flavobacteriaceae bacterium LMO-SS05]